MNGLAKLQATVTRALRVSGVFLFLFVCLFVRACVCGIINNKDKKNQTTRSCMGSFLSSAKTNMKS